METWSLQGNRRGEGGEERDAVQRGSRGKKTLLGGRAAGAGRSRAEAHPSPGAINGLCWHQPKLGK